MVRDVGHLVSQDRPELPLVHELEDPLRHGDLRVLRVPAGRERVRLGHVRHVDLRHREMVRVRQLADDPVQLRVLLLRHGLRPRRRDRDRARPPVHRDVEDQGDRQAHDGSLGAAQPRADQHEQAAERGDQDPGLDAVDAGSHRSITSLRG